MTSSTTNDRKAATNNLNLSTMNNDTMKKVPREVRRSLPATFPRKFWKDASLKRYRGISIVLGQTLSYVRLSHFQSTEWHLSNKDKACSTMVSTHHPEHTT
eukprot:scaffold542_cov154-Skeletonema_menzelii.AAC.16